MVMPGITALFFALILALVFSVFLNRTGPWSGGLWFFLLIFLGAWAIGTWTTPVGPVWMGVSWVPFLVGALAIALLITAIAEPRARPVAAEADTEPETEAAAAIGIFFWIVILLLAVVIAFGAYY